MRVGLIGTGRIGAFHARTLAAFGDVELLLTDVDRGRAEALAAELRGRFVATTGDMLAAGIDALVIAASTPAHAPLLHAAAEAGVPAFCEKPIALDLATTDAAVEHVASSGVLVQIGFQRRFDAGYVRARDLVRTGAAGELQVVRLMTHDPAPPPIEYVAVSGGVWRDQAIHDFDIAPWVVGRPVVEVYADGHAFSSAIAAHDDVDATAAILRFEGGTLGVLTGTRTDPRGYDVRMEIYGTKESLAVGLDARTPLRSVEPGVEPPPEPAYATFIERFAGAYRAEMRAFVDAVRDGTPSPCTAAEARRALAVALAADTSRRERRPVRVDEVG